MAALARIDRGVSQRHIEEVKTTVPADNLLVFDVKEGWEPLCRFLEVDVPDEAVPHTNSSKDFGEKVMDQG